MHYSSIRKAGIILLLLSERCFFPSLVKSFHTSKYCVSIGGFRMSTNKKSQQISKKSLKTSRSAEQEQSPVYEVSTDSFNGITVRKVQPYVQDFQTFTKARWINREIFEIVSKEFGSQLPSSWLKSINNGNLKVNGKTITPSYIMKSGDHMVHRTHRHEPPVFGDIIIVGETEEILAVNKPASMPMHPCGAYRHNSLLSILQNDLYKDREKVKDLRLVHRLDRVTSGLVILAKSKDTASLISEEIRNKSTEKVYLARVIGRFPAPQLLNLHQWESIPIQPYLNDSEENDEVTDDLLAESDTLPSSGNNNTKKRKSSSMLQPKDCNDTSSLLVPKVAMTYEELQASDKVGYACKTTVDQGIEYWISCPTTVLSHRDGIHACDTIGKASLSIFRCIGYDETSNTSLIECQPVTGRTHQLRLHLQLCGTPIANDPCYGGTLFFGNDSKKELAIAALTRFQRFNIVPLSKIPHTLALEVAARQQDQVVQDVISTADVLRESIDQPTELTQQAQESDDAFLARNCRYCQANQEIMALEQYIHCDGIWLHAYRYAGKTWSFSTPWPSWASIFPITKLKQSSTTDTKEENGIAE